MQASAIYVFQADATPWARVCAPGEEPNPPLRILRRASEGECGHPLVCCVPLPSLEPRPLTVVTAKESIIHPNGTQELPPARSNVDEQVVC